MDDSVGGLFPPGDPRGLADVVVRLLSDSGLPARGEAGRRRVVAHWSNARLAQRHLEIYRALAARKRPAPPPTAARDG